MFQKLTLRISLEKRKKIKNLFAYFVSRGWNALLILIVTPVYIQLLGIESFGLIGFYGSLCAVCSISDLGLSDTFCKESAKLVSRTRHSSPSILHTLEIFYWGIGAVVCILFLFSTRWISQKWLLDPSSFPQERLSSLLQFMAIALFFLWIQIFYSKGLQGLQAHILNNSVQCCGTALKHGGALIALYWHPTLEMFFYWQVVSSAIQAFFMLAFTWKNFSYYKVPRAFSLRNVSRFWKFSVQMSAIHLSSSLLQQIDKLLVSYFFSLQTLGYYTFSYTVASSLYYFIYPIGAYYYPLFIQYIEEKKFQQLKIAYYSSNRLACIVLIFITLLLFIFMRKLLFLWTGDTELTEHCLPLVKVFMLGVLLNSIMSLSFYMQFAFEDTRALLYQNLYSILCMIPLCLFLIHFFGILGLACFYLILNIGYLVFNMRVARHQLLIHQG